MNDLNKGNESYVEIGICIDAVKLLQNCSWPGNVRQLKSYIENLYNYCKYHKNSLITVEMIKTDPPREKASFVDNKLSQMEIILTHFLKNWKVEKGKFLDDFLSPIVAKLCVDNLKDIVNTRNASELIGLDWSRGKNSTMIKSYKKYDSIKT